VAVEDHLAEVGPAVAGAVLRVRLLHHPSTLQNRADGGDASLAQTISRIALEMLLDSGELLSHSPLERRVRTGIDDWLDRLPGNDARVNALLVFSHVMLFPLVEFFPTKRYLPTYF